MKNNVIGFFAVALFAAAAIAPLYVISLLLDKLNKTKATKMKLLSVAGIVAVLVLWLPWVFLSGFIFLALLCSLSGQSSCLML